MTIKPGLAVFTAVSSAVLVFGNSAHAAGPDFLGYPPSSITATQESLPPSGSEAPVEAPALAPPPKPLAMKKKIKLDNPKTIATKTYIPTYSKPTTIRPAYTSSAGNAYAWGQCTWHVKNMRPDLPNNLGNGGQWVANAAAQGFATGTTPRAGAVGEQPGHVVYVKSVNKNGTVNISEMNYNGGVGVVNHRTVPASAFTYIY